jgi:hypothetical protein
LASFAAGRLDEAQLFLPKSKNAQRLNLNQLAQADLNYHGAWQLYDGAPTKIPRTNASNLSRKPAWILLSSSAKGQCWKKSAT